MNLFSNWMDDHLGIAGTEINLTPFVADKAKLNCLVGGSYKQTIGRYLMPNPVYTYILNIYTICNLFIDDILKRAWAFFCTQLNGFKYYFITITI